MRWLMRWCALVLALACAAPAQGQDEGLVLRAALSERQTFVGSPVTLRIELENAEDATPPAPPRVEHASVRLIGTAQQSAAVLVINGRRVDTGGDKVIFEYEIVPERPGEIAVPPITVSAGGQTALTPELRLRVVEPIEDPKHRVTLEVSDEEPYVDEPIFMTARFHLSEGRVTSLAFLGEWDHDAADVHVVNPPQRSGLTRRDMEILGLRSDWRTGEDGNGQQYVEIELMVVPRRAGQMRLGPITAVFDVAPNRRARTERRASKSNAVELRVRPVPTEGQPEHYEGLIGSFEITSTASPVKVRVGDPIDLYIQVTGRQGADAVRAPSLEDQPWYDGQFKLSPEGWDEIRSSQPSSKAFKTTVRATSDSVEDVPPIELAYFDTELGEYRIARSRPIPLTVSPSREVTLEDATGGAAGFTPGVAKETLQPTGPNLRANDRSAEALRNETFDVLELATTPSGMTVIAAPPVGVGLASLVLAARRRRDPAQRRRVHAKRRALAALRARGDVDAKISRGVRVYVADRFGLVPEAVVGDDCRRLIGPCMPEHSEELARLLERAELSRSQGSSAGSPEMSRSDVERAGELVRLADKELSS